MGALSSSHKRSRGSYTLDHQIGSSHSPLFQFSKKIRSSSMILSPDSKSAPSRSSKFARYLARYPETKRPIRREVHAPCRIFKFGLTAPSPQEPQSKDRSYTQFQKQEVVHDIGKLLDNYNRTTKIALGSLSNLNNNTEVIDLDDDDDNDDDESDDSSVEEVVLIRDERDGRHAVTTGVQKARGKKVEGNLQSSSSSSATKLNNGVNNGRLNVDLVGKGLNCLSLSLNRKALRLSLRGEECKKLLQSTEKRTSELKELGFLILLHEKRRELMRWLHLRLRKPAEKVRQELLTPLTKEEIAEVQHAFSAKNRREVLVTHCNSNINITGQLMHCLMPGGWLNDEVINLYLELLKERETREPQFFLKCHFFNTFFYQKLVAGGSGYSYNAVRRWTSEKKLGYHLFECDKIFVPVHKEVHWCLAVINKKDRKFQYLDSLKGMDERVLRTVAKYFVEEVKEKSGINLDVSSWDREIIEDLPEQQNGFDCGMFMLKYVDCYSRGLGLCFGQQHMPYFRLRTAKEILKLRAN